MSAGNPAPPDNAVRGDGELRTTRNPQIVVVPLSRGAKARRQVRVSRIDGFSVYEGDIILGNAVTTLGAVVSGPGKTWPEGIVVYDIHPNLPDPDRVKEAIDHWEEKTRSKIRFRKRVAETSYVFFREGSGCSSSVGWQGNTAQLVTLGPFCSVGNAIHEIGHTIGLWHEQSREDRNQNVTVDWSNIDPLEAHNFDQHITDGDDVGKYDYGSIMHYPKDAFAVVAGKPTIVTPHGEAIGQRDALSAGDLEAVERLYA
jgi:hypothetical protein